MSDDKVLADIGAELERIEGARRQTIDSAVRADVEDFVREGCGAMALVLRSLAKEEHRLETVAGMRRRHLRRADPPPPA